MICLLRIRNLFLFLVLRGANAWSPLPSFQRNLKSFSKNDLCLLESCQSAAAAAALATFVVFSPLPAAPPAWAKPVAKEAYSAVDEVWNLVDKYYIDKSFHGQDWKKIYKEYKAMEGKKDDIQLVTEMVKKLDDKYSRILDKSAYEAIQKYDLIGVGVTLMPDSNKQMIVGAPPVRGSAADLAGIKFGDFVTAINGVDTKGRNAFDIINQVSENPNAETISFSIRSQGPDDLPGEGTSRDITMKREFVKVKDPIRYKISEARSDGTKVGYIRILEFNALIKGKLEEAIASLEAQGANAYVLDLRMNSGGAFQSAVEISSLFVDDKVATYVVDNNQVELPFRTAKGRLAVEPEDPLVIWQDKYSASASEVFAGSLHDNCRAVVMGDNSFGKGLIQAVYGLKNGAGLVLTVARYVTPNGVDIQDVGITPDIKGNVPMPIPGFDSDTSKVDFADVARRLDPSMCKMPVQVKTTQTNLWD